MAVLREREQRWDEARAHIARSLAARPEHVPSLMIAARIAQASGDAHGVTWIIAVSGAEIFR